jgi:thiol-disulfide isomerase/thioredoxin
MKYALLLLAVFFFGYTTNAQEIKTYKVNDLIKRISNPDTFYVVNFWATWCGPCIKELPEFDKISAAFDGKPVKVLLVSMDFKEAYPKKIIAAIKKKKLTHEVIWFNETNANEFIPKISNEWQGSIPATLLSYKKMEYTSFFEGSIMAPRIQTLIEKQLALQ